MVITLKRAVTENGAPYALSVHRGGVEVQDVESAAAAPQEADEEGLPPHNRHGHLLICERIDDGIERTAKEWFRRANKKEPALGGAAKDREMNGGNWVPEVRHLCADYINYGLERAGFSERVTCESHETRIARAEAAGDEETAERLRLNPPGIHLGPTAWAIEKGREGRKGRASWRGNLNRAIASEGQKIRSKVEELNAQLGQLDIQEAAVTEKLEAARRIAAVQFEQREKALLETSLGGEILRAARESAAPPSVVRLGEMVEVAEERFGAALDLREAGFRETSVGSRYLVDATQSILGETQSPTLPQRELIITTAESRLEQDLDRIEKEHVARAGHERLLVEAAGTLVVDSRTLSLVERWTVYEWAESRFEEEQRELDREEAAVGKDPAGEEFLRSARLEVLGDADREATLADRARIVKAAATLQKAAAAKREAEAKQRAEQQKWEEQRNTRVRALDRQLGGVDLYYAHLADRDPQWDRKRNDRSSREHIDAALASSSSDGTRLERLRVVLSDKVDAARYREELGKVGGQFKTSDLDRVLAVVEQEREERETRQWEEQRDAGFRALSRQPGGVDLYIRPGYRIPALCNELLDGLVREDDDAFFKATVAALRKRYQRRAGYDLAYEERYDDRDRRTSQQAYLQDAVTTEQSSSARPSWSAALATVLKKYLSKIRKLFRIACDKVLGGDLGERLVRHREQVRRAADAAGAALPAMSPWLGSSAVPAVSDETLMTAAVSASTPFVKEVAIEVGERYKRQARYDTASEERYDHNDRRQSEKGYLHDTIERRRLRSPRSFTIPSRVAVEAEVFEEHRASLLEVFEVACDEVVGRGDLGKRVRQRREQVSRVADAVVQELPTTTQSYGRVDAVLAERVPQPELKRACRSCDFFKTACLGSMHEHTVLELPKLHHATFQKLCAAGIVDITDVPTDFKLNGLQQRAKAVAESGETFVAPEIGNELAAIEWPCHYLDFETVASIMPLYEGHGCHHQVLTQFSVHHRDSLDAAPSHSEFLADAEESQERLLAECLIKVLGTHGAIVVYSNFENVRVKALVDEFPDLADPLNAIRARFVDFERIIKKHVYHPAFAGSFSLKKVVPALVTDVSYDGLAIADGDNAIATFARMARGEIENVAEARRPEDLFRARPSRVRSEISTKSGFTWQSR